MNDSNELGPQTTDRYAPRPMKPGATLALTLKLFAILALIAGLLWGINVYTDVQ